jgi:hypothetical protein
MDIIRSSENFSGLDFEPAYFGPDAVLLTDVMGAGRIQARIADLRTIRECTQGVRGLNHVEVIEERGPNSALFSRAEGISLEPRTNAKSEKLDFAKMPTTVKIDALHIYLEMLAALHNNGRILGDHKADSVFVAGNGIAGATVTVVDPGLIGRTEFTDLTAIVRKLRDDLREHKADYYDGEKQQIKEMREAMFRYELHGGLAELLPAFFKGGVFIGDQVVPEGIVTIAQALQKRSPNITRMDQLRSVVDQYRLDDYRANDTVPGVVQGGVNNQHRLLGLIYDYGKAISGRRYREGENLTVVNWAVHPDHRESITPLDIDLAIAEHNRALARPDIDS